jgi:transcriptional regulator with XRE-family HTH domain
LSKLPPTAGSVARLIDASLSSLTSRRSVKEIARLAGMSPTMLSMVRYGRNKLPVEYVPKLAKALELDPRRLLLLVMEEGMRPEARQVLLSLLGRLVTDNEMAIIEIVRIASDGRDPAVTRSIEDGLLELFGR